MEKRWANCWFTGRNGQILCVYYIRVVLYLFCFFLRKKLLHTVQIQWEQQQQDLNNCWSCLVLHYVDCVLSVLRCKLVTFLLTKIKFEGNISAGTFRAHFSFLLQMRLNHKHRVNIWWEVTLTCVLLKNRMNKSWLPWWRLRRTESDREAAEGSSQSCDWMWRDLQWQERTKMRDGEKEIIVSRFDVNIDITEQKDEEGKRDDREKSSLF